MLVGVSVYQALQHAAAQLAVFDAAEHMWPAVAALVNGTRMAQQWTNTCRDRPWRPRRAERQLCCAACRIPASQLATPSHVEVQIVFKGEMPGGHLQWDNNEGNNWQVGCSNGVQYYCIINGVISTNWVISTNGVISDGVQLPGQGAAS